MYTHTYIHNRWRSVFLGLVFRSSIKVHTCSTTIMLKAALLKYIYSKPTEKKKEKKNSKLTSPFTTPLDTKKLEI